MAVIKKLVLASIWCFFCWRLGSSSGDHESYLGCFYDTYSPDGGVGIRVLSNGELIRPFEMTIGVCINFCVARTVMMRFAGLETGNECYCGAEGSQYDQYEKRDNECLQPCDGNSKQTCGDDFRIAVYDLSLIRCQIPEHLQHSSLLHLVPVNDNITFSCLPGYQILGSDRVQCIFDDSITDTRWSPDLPECISKPTTTYVGSSVNPVTNNITPLTRATTGGAETSPANTTIIGAVAGGCGLLAIICVTLVIIVCIRKRKQKGVPQTNNTPMSTTSSQNNNTGPEPSVSSFPENLYSRPIRPASRGQTNQETDNVYQYHEAEQVQKKKPNVVQSYEYADVQINSPNVTDTNQFAQGEPEEAGWADNNIYGRTEESSETLGEDGEGWKENNIYVTSSQ